MATLLLENRHLLTDSCKQWVKTLDPNYIEVNTQPNTYHREQDFKFFGIMVQPNIENIAVSSSFQTLMDGEAYASFLKDDNDEFLQIEYFSYILYNVMSYRQKSGTPMLTLHINYEGIDFLEKVNKGLLGEKTKSNLKMMFRHYEEFVQLKLYHDFVLINTIINEDELNFTR